MARAVCKRFGEKTNKEMLMRGRPKGSFSNVGSPQVGWTCVRRASKSGLTRALIIDHMCQMEAKSVELHPRSVGHCQYSPRRGVT
jgi:hypothetical protein